VDILIIDKINRNEKGGEVKCMCRSKGFTILELLVMVAIIAILAIIVILDILIISSIRIKPIIIIMGFIIYANIYNFRLTN